MPGVIPLSRLSLLADDWLSVTSSDDWGCLDTRYYDSHSSTPLRCLSFWSFSSSSDDWGQLVPYSTTCETFSSSSGPSHSPLSPVAELRRNHDDRNALCYGNLTHVSQLRSSVYISLRYVISSKDLVRYPVLPPLYCSEKHNFRLSPPTCDAF